MRDQREVINLLPLPGSTLAQPQVTEGQRSSSLFGVSPTWPFEEFRDYLRALMDAAKIVDYAVLSRLADVSEAQLSRWKYGTAQPSRESLAKIAPVLNVPAMNLWIAAGLATPEELNLDVLPDMRVLPQEFRDLILMYEDGRTGTEVKAFLRRSVAALVAGIRAESTAQGRPSGRRRAG